MGIDFKLYGEFVPGTDSWLTFSLMDTRMNINGKKTPLPTDQRYAVNLFFTDYFPKTDRWKMSLRLAYADGLPFGAPHRSLDSTPFRAPAYRRVDIGMSYRVINNEKKEKKQFHISPKPGKVVKKNVLAYDKSFTEYTLSNGVRVVMNTTRKTHSTIIHQNVV